MVSDNEWRHWIPGDIILRITHCFLPSRHTSCVAQRSQPVWKAKTWGTKLVWFLVLAFLLTLEMDRSNKPWWKVTFRWFYHFQPITFFLSTPNTWVYPGFQSLTEELSPLVRGRKERLYRLQRAVANSIELEEDGFSSMQEKYDMYKKGYLKFLRFDPEEETSQNKPTFSRVPLNPQLYSHVFQLL